MAAAWLIKIKLAILPRISGLMDAAALSGVHLGKDRVTPRA